MKESRLKEMREIANKATPAPWTGGANIPFYAYLNKPAPSLSKHEGTARGRHLWRIEDVTFVVAAREIMLELLDYVDTLRASKVGDE